MGSYWGHVIPALFLIPYGLVWCILSFWYHLTSSPATNKSCRKKASYRFQRLFKRRVDDDNDDDFRSWLPFCCCPRIPLEPLAKILFPVIAILIEIFLYFNPTPEGNKRLAVGIYHVTNTEGVIQNQEKMQHITQYSAFILSGLVDLLSLFSSLPKPSSRLFFSLSFFIEGFIFSTHLGGTNPYAILTHSITTFLAFACLFFTLMRLKTSSSFVINLGLGNCLLLQGTWFVQTAHFIFTDFLSERGGLEDDWVYNEAVIAFIAEAFTWHILILAASNLILWALIFLIVKCSFRSNGNDSEEEGMGEEMNELVTGNVEEEEAAKLET